MSRRKIVEDAIIMGTPLKRAKVIVDDAFELIFVRCTFDWCEFSISPAACALGPLFIECIVSDTCVEVGEEPQLAREHVSVGCYIHPRRDAPR